MDTAASRPSLHPLPDRIIPGQPPTALAPMQDITGHSFMHLLAICGAPDYYITEYYRVHDSSRLDVDIRRCICENTTGRPIIAQIIGEDPVHIRRAARELAPLPIAGIDLNLGCPAPKVFRKNVGGGLLRDPARVNEILAVLREESPGTLSVKMRYGFEDDSNFDTFLEIIDRHNVDLVSLHARTVRQLYRGQPDYSYITRAAKALRCPVLANGDIGSCEKAARVLKETGAFGAMIGRPAVRNPWIFRQCREHFAGLSVFKPTLADVREYVDRLWEVTDEKGLSDDKHIPRMKKLLNFIALGVDEEGAFLRAMRLTQTKSELMNLCDECLLENGNADKLFAPDAHAHLIARPNHEGPEKQTCE
ncbi:MAG: tRNA-dihydrouridine synthase family protein [Opitutales bacterium]|nr:tRNA-dihydrouridine synthase family protein [Opitutales bacterium]